MSYSIPLTHYLSNSCPHPLTRATTHPFLALAGRGALPKPILSQWLSQDRLYAQSYIRFIGLLLSKIRLPSHNPNITRPGTQTSLHRAVDLLIEALVNIQRELAFFEDVAREFGLDLTAVSPEEGMAVSGSGVDGGEVGGSKKVRMMKPTCPASSSSSCTATATTSAFSSSAAAATAVGGKTQENCCGTMESWSPRTTAGRGDPEKGCSIFFGPNRTTRAYIDMFMSAGSPAVSLLEGLVVLWATEECYLRAWRYAAGFLGEREDGNAGSGEGREDADGGALRVRFIPNWTSREFEAFVRRIGEVVDEVAGSVKGAEEGELMRGRCLEWWRQVLWLEERFWPDVN